MSIDKAILKAEIKELEQQLRYWMVEHEMLKRQLEAMTKERDELKEYFLKNIQSGIE